MVYSLGKSEKYQLWLSWGLWCLAMFWLYSLGLVFTFGITLIGGALGWRVAILCNWKNSAAIFAALVNSATVVACVFGWLMYYALSSATDL